MLHKLISKYGLATHLALLASLPLALSPFLSERDLSVSILWLSGFALIWLFLIPSILSGEHLYQARARVRHEMLADPLLWFFLFAVVFAGIRWLNSGIALQYDAEQSVWRVAAPSFSALPASVGEVGRLPFAVAVGVSVLCMGILHGLGLAARLSFGLVFAFLLGMGGVAAVSLACFGVEPFVTRMTAGFADGPSWGTFFGIGLSMAIACGTQAEAKKWPLARLPFCLSVAGNGGGLLFFAPSFVVAAYLATALLVLVFSLVVLSRSDSMGGVARSLMLVIFGMALPICLLAAVVPESVITGKLQGLDVAAAFPAAYRQMRATLSHVGAAMWRNAPWCGVGMGAFELHVPFLADKADLALLPPKVAFAPNGYWTLLAERGILGCLLLISGTLLLAFKWVRRFVGATQYLRTQDDADKFIFACPSIVWVPLMILAVFFAEALYDSAFSRNVILFAVLVPCALSAASFPRKPRLRENVSDQEN